MGKNTASSTASRAIRVANIAWCIAATIPAGARTNYQSGDNWKNIKYNFGAKPKPYPSSPELAKRAFNGVTIGKGHLAEAKAIINSPAPVARGAFANEVHHDHQAHVGSHCGTATLPNAMSCWRRLKT